ncbi:MAG TPA: NAD-dependent epimerase/dehydratase family protein [Myxococcales bacterium]|nr:NAD-dependent epimerase/dehydratase family protein [Myxococcales bacterium]
MPTWAVAGAAGFIGSHVVEVLRAAGHRVIATDRPGADLSVAREAGAEIREADLADPPTLRDTLEGCEIAVNGTGLFDLGASHEVLARVNVAGAKAFADAARSSRVRRLVHISSVSIYGLPERIPMNEDGPYHPRNPYEKTKLEGEQAVAGMHAPSFEVAVLRPTLVYGPRSRYGQGLFVAMLAQMRAFGGRRFPLLAGGPVGQHVHVRDVARAAVLCGTHPEAAGRAFNVADRVPLGFGETVGALLDACGIQAAPRIKSRLVARAGIAALAHAPSFAISRFNRQLQKGHEILVSRGLAPQLRPRLDRDWLQYFNGDFVFDTSRLASLGFTWEHPDLRTSIADVVRWYEAAGWLPLPRAKRETAETRREATS